MNDKKWTVWVGGTEVRDYLMTHEEATKTYWDYKNMGHSDVQMDKVGLETENKKFKELPNGDYIVWDILEGVEHFVYVDEVNTGSVLELYVGSNYDFAEKEYETAVKYFKGE
jgi:hypothetical protein